MGIAGKRELIELPYDKNGKPLSALIAAVVSGGNIVDYLPLKAVDNADGTATLSSTVNVTLDANVDIGNIHLLNILNAKIDPATEPKQDNIISQLTTLNTVDFATETTLAAAAASLVAIDTDLDVALSTRASEITLLTVAKEATLALVKTVLDGIKTAVDAINTTLDATLSTRASETTLDTVKDNTGLDDKTKIYEQTIAATTTFNVKADMDTKFSVTGATVRSVTVRTDQDVTAELNADGETFTIEANTPFTLDNFKLASVKLTPTVSTDVKILATGFGGV